MCIERRKYTLFIPKQWNTSLPHLHQHKDIVGKKHFTHRVAAKQRCWYSPMCPQRCLRSVPCGVFIAKTFHFWDKKRETAPYLSYLLLIWFFFSSLLNPAYLTKWQKLWGAVPPCWGPPHQLLHCKFSPNPIKWALVLNVYLNNSGITAPFTRKYRTLVWTGIQNVIFLILHHRVFFGE